MTGRYRRRPFARRALKVLMLDLRHRCQLLASLGLIPKFFGQDVSGMFFQQFVGHVTIVPQQKMRDTFKAVQNPSKGDMRAYIAGGRRAAWPKLGMVRHVVALEQCLRRCARALAARRAPGGGGGRGRVTARRGNGGGRRGLRATPRRRRQQRGGSPSPTAAGGGPGASGGGGGGGGGDGGGGASAAAWAAMRAHCESVHRQLRALGHRPPPMPRGGEGLH